MVLTVNKYKRNKSTGKLEKVGSSTIGNVAQSGGGYKKGAVSTTIGNTTVSLPQNNMQSLSGPVYGAQQATGIVPNTSTAQGPVYTPPPVPGSEAYDQGGGAPLTSPQTVSPAGGVATNPLPQQSTPQQANNIPFKDKSFIDQYKELAFGREYAPPNPELEASLAAQGLESGGAAPITPDDLLMFYGLSGVAKEVTFGLASMAKQGAQALTREGLDIAAANAAKSAASGALGKAGKAAPSTAAMKQLVKIASGSGIGRLASLGFILAVAKSSADSRGDRAAESVELAAKTAELVNKMQRSGDPDLMAQATQLNEEQRAVAQDLDSFLKYMPFKFFQGRLEDEVKALRNEINKGNIEYDNYVQDSTGEAILEQLGNNPDQEEVDAAEQFKSGLSNGPLKTKIQKAINDAQSNANTITETAEATEAEKNRAFQTSEREARQAYEQSVREQTAADKQFAEDTATTTSEGGTLTFGLLGDGGSTEFVSADRAAKAYFGKVYDELTPAQKKLLNLLKGKGG